VSALFARPELLWLALAAPAAAALGVWLWRRRLAAERAWAAGGLWPRLAAGRSRPRRLASTALVAVAVLGAATALARPRWGSSQQTVERQGVDVVFVLDSSLSMGADDAAPSRLWVARSLIRRLAERLPGNRVALVQAEGEGVVMTPLTVDVAILDLLLDAVEPGSLPVPGTELAPALDTAVGLYDEGGRGHRVMVLVSDGEDHGGGLAEAAERLREQGVVVHAIGVGTREGAPVRLPGSGETKRDEQGQVVISRLDEAALESMARETGGHYLRATSAAADLGPVVDRIAGMEKRARDVETRSTQEERFQWPHGLAAAALVAHQALGPFRPRRRRAAQPAAAPAPARRTVPAVPGPQGTAPWAAR
jgi:Ca-activated chloride channel family protein